MRRPALRLSPNPSRPSPRSTWRVGGIGGVCKNGQETREIGTSSDFAPLLDSLERRFTGIEERLADLKRGVDTLRASVAGYAKHADGYLQEMGVPTHQVEPHERWLHEIADTLGVKLEY